MKAVIFLGPSLPVAEAREILDAVYLPPARQSDLVSAVGIHRPDVIGLVDGEFGQALSVWHKEILYALEQGIPVYGASSMGALRAAETHSFGMIGVGQVFGMFASGELSGDDEVALAHALDEAGHRPLSEPMVNLRLNFRAARDAGVIDAATADQLTALAKAMYFPERSFARVLRAGAAAGVPADAVDRLRAWLAANYRDAKREDARELLRALRDLPRPVARHQPSFTLERTPAFVALYERDRKVSHDGVEIPLVAIANHAALHVPGFAELNFNALNRVLAGVLANLLEVEVKPEDVATEARRFRVRSHLADDAAFAAWLERNDLRPDEFDTLMRSLAEARALHAWLTIGKSPQRTTKDVLDELRLRGLYEKAAADAVAQQRIVEEHFPFPLDTPEAPDTLRLVIDHLRATPCRMDTSFGQWSEEAGFDRVDDLRRELLRARAARGHVARVADGTAGAAFATVPG